MAQTAVPSVSLKLSLGFEPKKILEGCGMWFER